MYELLIAMHVQYACVRGGGKSLISNGRTIQD